MTDIVRFVITVVVCYALWLYLYAGGSVDLFKTLEGSKQSLSQDFAKTNS